MTEQEALFWSGYALGVLVSLAAIGSGALIVKRFFIKP